jgi:glycosyltransferase involved in cell wall biosynthesis
MKVLHVLGELRSSGAEVMLRSAGPLWRQHGVYADILATGDRVGPYARVLETQGYRIHHLPFERSPRFALRFHSFLGQHDYDVAHLHTERAFIHLGLASRARRMTVVRTVHSAFPFEGALQRRRSYQRRLARWAGIRFVAIGPSVAENERRFANPTRVVNNWLEVDRFTPTQPSQREAAREQLGVPPNGFVAVTVGNCSPTKNHASLLQALSQLEDPMFLLHVGEESDLPERELASRLGLQDRCRFLGRTDPLPALRAADLFVMPSLYEGLGIASLEALSTGLPAVLTDVPGSVDLRDVSEDIVWSPTDPEGLSAALARARVRFHGHRASSAREKQAALIRERYSPMAGVTGYTTTYRECAG